MERYVRCVRLQGEQMSPDARDFRDAQSQRSSDASGTALPGSSRDVSGSGESADAFEDAPLERPATAPAHSGSAGFPQTSVLPHTDGSADDGDVRVPISAASITTNAVQPPAPRVHQLAEQVSRPQTAPASPSPGNIADGAFTVSQPWGPRAQALRVRLLPS